jgi:hypothetical protein
MDVALQVLQNKLLIKRFVMERLLYSEIGGFNALKSRDNMGPPELEYKINSSIGLTLNFFNDTLPSIFASVYAFGMHVYSSFTIFATINLQTTTQPHATSLRRG